jgi:hypothetical protein
MKGAPLGYAPKTLDLAEKAYQDKTLRLICQQHQRLTEKVL